jgi:hypothetical protein
MKIKKLSINKKIIKNIIRWMDSLHSKDLEDFNL